MTTNSLFKEIGLSNRTKNVLLKMGVRSLSELEQVSLDDIFAQGGAGDKTIEEISQVKERIKRGEFSGITITPSVSEEQLLEFEKYDLSSIKLSTRANNVLQSANIKTIKELVGLTIEDIMKMPNAGNKTVIELTNVVKDILNGTIQLEPPKKNCRDKIDIPAEHSIDELNLSVRSYNALVSVGINTINSLIELNEDDIDEIKNIGRKSKTEIKEKLNDWVNQNVAFGGEPKKKSVNISAVEEEFFKNLSDAIAPVVTLDWTTLYHVTVSQNLFFSDFEIDNENILRLLSLPELLLKEKERYSLLFPKNCPVPIDVFKERISVLGDVADVFSTSLFKNHICRYLSDYVVLTRGTLLEYWEKHFSNTNDRNTQFLIRRLKGETLNSIGDEFGVTRERVRQVSNKIIKKMPLLLEDYLKEPFVFFNIPKESFCGAFDFCSAEGYEYLSIKYDHGKTELSAESLESYKGPFQKELLQQYRRDCISRDKASVTRRDIVFRVLIDNSDKSISLEDLNTKYYEYLDSHDYPRERLYLNNRYLTAHLRTFKHVVFNRENKARYCNADYDLIWNEIDFSTYKGQVFSAEKIYRDYQDLMSDQDVRSGYELYCILKSSLNEHEDVVQKYGIDCVRIPSIRFGNGTEEKQALLLLYELAPIELGKYYLEYEKRFGIWKETAQANPSIWHSVQQYLMDGKLVVDAPTLDPRDYEIFSEVIKSRDFWFINELEEAFRVSCKNSPFDSLNACTIKKFGYSLNSGYVFDSIKYGTITNYFEKTYFSSDVVDLSLIDKRISTIAMFISTLDRKKKSLEYVEVTPKKLLPIQKVKVVYGLDLEDIKKIQEEMACYYDLPVFNGYSIWENEKDNPLIQKLNQNKWMLSCIIRQQEGIYSRNICGSYILSKDSNNLSIVSVCEWIVLEKGKQTVENLVTQLDTIFGCKASKNKVIVKLKESNKWDCLVIDSFDDYVDSLIENDSFDLNDAFQEEFF